jgi:hypothetical protein
MCQSSKHLIFSHHRDTQIGHQPQHIDCSASNHGNELDAHQQPSPVQYRLRQYPWDMTNNASALLAVKWQTQNPLVTKTVFGKVIFTEMLSVEEHF